ncbi:MAG: hypothetical protein PHS41_04735 [Victivallaceae bacterium]|nr:hypothetical protein [Victivallaceae bacterium]
MKCRSHWESILFAGGILLLTGCRSFNSDSAELERKAHALLDTDAWIRSFCGTPGEYAARRRCHLDREAAIFRGELPGDRRAAAEQLAACYDAAERGRRWQAKPMTLPIARMVAPPEIDGIVSPAERAGATEVCGEYLLDSEQKHSDAPRWWVGWTVDTLYFAVEFPDCDIQAFSGRKIPSGDALECFLRPNPEENLYYEILVNPEGARWCLSHLASRTGSHFLLNLDKKMKMRSDAKRSLRGYCVEIAIPANQLHGLWCAQPPRIGDRLEFQMVRTNLESGTYRKSAPFPLLYDGHNLYGWMRGILSQHR